MYMLYSCHMLCVCRTVCATCCMCCMFIVLSVLCDAFVVCVLRTQPLENLSHYLCKKGLLSNPAPGESLLSGSLVMETGCRNTI